MNYKLDVELSPELETYRAKIEATIKPYIEIKLTDKNHPSWWQSKFRGFPYLPKYFEYPKSWDGEYLYLLAQINFTEVPRLDNFPNKGILQFYIAADETYGYNCNQKQFDKPNKFISLYFPEIYLDEDDLVTDFSFLPKLDLDSYFPINGCCEVEFSKKFSPVSITDYRFNIFDKSQVTIQVYDEYYEKFNSDGHKIGGYATSIQGDIRDLNPDYEELLLQIDTDSNHVIDINWGGGGVSIFFINQSDLKNRDFSDVFYYWDCG